MPDRPALAGKEIGRAAWRPAPDAVLAASSFGMAGIPHLAALLNVKDVVRARLFDGRPDGYIGWGERFAARRSMWHARLRGKPYWTVEDGFIRSIGLGKAGAPAMSIVTDDLGIYYQARRPSRLEEMIAGTALSPAENGRASRIAEFILSHRLTKYNCEPDRPLKLPARSGKCIVIADQVAHDASISGALADEHTFLDMVAAARAERPGALLCLRVHPDVAAGRASGVLAHRAQDLGLHVLDKQVNSHAVIDAADEIWTVSSQLGFEALLHGKAVVCFAVPFYAGFGLTQDRPSGEEMAKALARRRPVALGNIVHAAFIGYMSYADPVHGTAIAPEAALERLASRRRQYELRGGHYVCRGFSLWKQPMVQAFLDGPFSQVRFVADAGTATDPEERLCTWGIADGSEPRPSEPVTVIEDGFVRSVGLGSNFLPPLSLCIDDTGIYYDSRRPSRLERLLEEDSFDAALLQRARRARERIVSAGITKYNLGSRIPADLRARAGDREIILVPGQIENDASIKYGAPRFTRNLDLLRTVRESNRVAFIVYKEHPDIIAGNRPGRIGRAEASALCDLLVEEGDLSGWLEAVDAIHVNTSLAGFEALLRGKKVTCWGQPFYAGWGLTRDMMPVSRRARRRSLDELVAAALILYPRYVDPVSRQPIEIEDALDLIEKWRLDGLPDVRSSPVRGPVMRGWRYIRAGAIARFEQARDRIANRRNPRRDHPSLSRPSDGAGR
jgi:capsular polysaccharide export protein